MSGAPSFKNVEVAEGVTLHVEIRGNGPAVMLLHGFTGDHTTLGVLAQRLSSTNRVVVPDLVGHGRSSSPDSDVAHSVDAMVGHVLGLTDLLELGRRLHLVGYSMGGRVALAAACRHPDRLASLTLIGASAGLAGAQERRARSEADEALAAGIERDGLEAFVDRWMANPVFATQARLGPEFLARARAQRLDNDAAALARSLRGAGTGVMTPLHDRLADCAVPTTVVAGADDPKFTGIAGELAAAMPRAEVVLIEGAGHAAHLEQPDAVAAAIRARMAAP